MDIQIIFHGFTQHSGTEKDTLVCFVFCSSTIARHPLYKFAYGWYYSDIIIIIMRGSTRYCRQGRKLKREKERKATKKTHLNTICYIPRLQGSSHLPCLTIIPIVHRCWWTIWWTFRTRNTIASKVLYFHFNLYGLELQPSGTKRVNQETFFKLSVCHGFLVVTSYKLSQWKLTSFREPSIFCSRVPFGH